MPDATKNGSGGLTVRGLDPKLIQRAKSLVHGAGRTLRELVADALKAEIERLEAKRGALK